MASQGTGSFLVIFLAFMSNVACHQEIAGSCASPKSGHHGSKQSGDGGYNITLLPEAEYYSPGQDVVFVIHASVTEGKFRGFQLICEDCLFPTIEENEDVQLNEKYCDKPGRVSHTNRAEKSEVRINATLPSTKPENGNLKIGCFVVKADHEWFGPLKLIVPMEPNGSRENVEELAEEGLAAESARNLEHCEPSDQNDFMCMAKLKSYFKVHWSIFELVPENGTAAQMIRLLLEAKTPGWASLSFAKIKGRMHPADAALGWIDEDGTHDFKAYHIIKDDVKKQNENSSVLTIESITRKEEWLHLIFSKVESEGLVTINLLDDVYVNYAIGRNNKLVEHNKYGSAVISFISGDIKTVSFRKYYQVHGALMIIAWVALLPLAILVARLKWSPQGMGQNGWLDLHRGIHLFVVISVVCALLIAIINFQPIESNRGKMHRVLGILTSLIFFLQIFVGVFRPGVKHELRTIFNVGHAWCGRCLALLAIITIFVGISAFHAVTNSSVFTWIFFVVLIIVVQLGLSLYVEVKLTRNYYNEGEVEEIGMVQMPYSRPEIEDESEEIDNGYQE